MTPTSSLPSDPFEWEDGEKYISPVTGYALELTAQPLTGGIPRGLTTPNKETRMKNLATAAQPTAKPAFRLSTFASDGEYTKLDALAGQEVMIHSLERMHSDTYDKDFYKAGVTDASRTVHVVALGQTLILPAIEAMLASFAETGEEVPYPIAVRFVKSGRTWTIE